MEDKVVDIMKSNPLFKDWSDGFKTKHFVDGMSLEMRLTRDKRRQLENPEDKKLKM